MKGRELEQIGQINAIASGKIFRSNTLIWIKEKFHGIGIFAMTIKEFFLFSSTNCSPAHRQGNSKKNDFCKYYTSLTKPLHIEHNKNTF